MTPRLKEIMETEKMHTHELMESLNHCAGCFEQGFTCAVEAMEKEMRVVEIPEKKCDDDNGDCHFFCQKEFETECQLYKKDLHDVINKIETLYEYIKPSFCTAKRVKILIED